MKKLLLFSFVSFFVFGSIAQNRIPLRSNIKSASLKRTPAVEKDPMAKQVGEMLYLNHGKSASLLEEEIGQTVYDLQCNNNVENRTWIYADGTMAATWTYGISAPSFAERGTGYQYYDGTAWQAMPTARVESIRTGWPSYAPLGANGECIVAHNGTQLVFSKRDTRGTGAWTQTLIPYDPAVNPTWPRMCTSGDNVYIIAADQGVAFQGMTDPLLFYRSQDAGVTWDIQCQVPAELANYTEGIGIDLYSWANPVGNTIAFVAGDAWRDIVLMKSNDGGTTWNKTVIFDSPWDGFQDSVLIDQDTISFCDGTITCALDAAGNAYVAWGIMRYMNTDTTDGSYEYFPGTDGIGFWREGDPMLTVNELDPDTLYNRGRLIAWILDLDNSGVLYDGYVDNTSFPSYYFSQTTMPQLMIDSTDNIYLIYKGTNENMQSGVGQFYSHIWGRASFDGGFTWCDFVELTDGVDHDQVECIWPNMAKNAYNGTIGFQYMSDFEPGLGVGNGAEDPTGTNSIYFATVSEVDFPYCFNTGIQEVNMTGMVQLYPNPVADYMEVSFNNNKISLVKMNIFNSVGSLVKSDEFMTGRGEKTRVNTNDLSNGIYLVKFETENNTITKKIIKK